MTTVTNGFGDVAIVGGHDKFFALWPIYSGNNTGIGTDDPEKFAPSLPFYLQSRSPKRDSTTVLWPFFSWIDEREKKYREWQGPWPLVIFTRGEGKTTSRVWPLFSQSHNARPGKRFLSLAALPVSSALHSDPLDVQRTRVMFYLYDDTVEKNTQTGAEKRRVDMWPFFTWHRDFNGNNRLQILRASRAGAAGQPRHRTQLVAALVVVAGGGQSQNRRRQPVVALESLPPRHDAGVQKMLAPVRPFPVSIGCGREKCELFYIPVSKPNPRRQMKKEECK